MKTKIILIAICVFTSFTNIFAHKKAVFYTNNHDISENLDLRAVASLFGDSDNLEDFEYRLNNPKYQISNLDLNEDNKVDYLRVLETIEGRAHIIVIQSVLGFDKYQDVATVEIEKDYNNTLQVQVVGDPYLYGGNYIYEPIYVHTPTIYASFWTTNYHPYCSKWNWEFYPSFYVTWSPFPVYHYRNHIYTHINIYNNYNYVNYRRCTVAYNAYYTHRKNYCEVTHPNYSFNNRNRGYTNKYDFDKHRRLNYSYSRRNYSENNSVNYSRRNLNYANKKSNSNKKSYSIQNRNYTNYNRNNSIKNNSNNNFTRRSFQTERFNKNNNISQQRENPRRISRI